MGWYMLTEQKQHRKKKSLLNEVQLKSIFFYFISILFVQLALIVIIVGFLVADGKRKADNTADEAAEILLEPLYNVDDEQAIRLGNTFLSSARVSGMIINTSANGIIMSNVPDQASLWIEPQEREIHYKDFYLGKITVYYSDEEILRNIKSFILILIVVLITLFTAIVFANRFFVTGNVRAVLADISKGINEIASGNYAWEIPLSHYEDIDSMIHLLNNMTEKVRSNDEKLRTMNTFLEERVAERTKDLESSLKELRQMQERLVESGKLTALGQLSAGIAHELNTPLGAIISSVSSVIEYFDTEFQRTLSLMHAVPKRDLEDLLFLLGLGIDKNRELSIPENSYRTMKKIEASLDEAGIQSPKQIASILVGVGLFEDFDDILPKISGKKSAEYLDLVESVSLSRRMLTVIQESALKATSVIEALRSYLIHDVKTDLQVVEIDKNIRQVLTLMHNLLKQGIKIDLSAEPVKVMAFSNSLSLVWINLIRNAAQAMDYKGTLKITAVQREDKAVITFRDTGCGIPPGIIERIFEPFFTTKHSGEGMGLGLDICKRIVESYQGDILVVSQDGYTEFTVSFPAIIE